MLARTDNRGEETNGNDYPDTAHRVEDSSADDDRETLGPAVRSVQDRLGDGGRLGGAAMRADTLAEIFRQIIANNRAGGWRRLKREG